MGDGVNNYTICKNINVQAHPGRGAKVVVPRPRSIAYQQRQIIQKDGVINRHIVKMTTRFVLGPGCYLPGAVRVSI